MSAFTLLALPTFLGTVAVLDGCKLQAGTDAVNVSGARTFAGLTRTGLLAGGEKGQYARAKEQHATHSKRALPTEVVKHDASCR